MMTTAKQRQDLMLLLMMMGIQKEQIMEISAALDSQEMLHSFLNKLSEKNYEMTPEEVYEASIETALEFQK